MAKKKILLIEDEADFVMMIKMRLEANNYETISACDGKEGLNRARQENPDLILLDVLIPKVNGLTLCRQLKDDFKTKNIPIIIVSASGGSDLPKRSRDAGADDIIIKPFEAKELLDKIAKYLGQ